MNFPARNGGMRCITGTFDIPAAVKSKVVDSGNNV
jgi:hypothetical protein